MAKSIGFMGHFVDLDMNRTVMTFFVFFAGFACQETTGTLSFDITTSQGSNLLEQIETLEVELTDPPKLVSRTRTSSGISLSFDVAAKNQQGALFLRGYDNDGTLIATGKSPNLPIAAIDAELSLFMAPPRSLTDAPVALPEPLSEAGAAALASTVLLVGGVDPLGALKNELLFFNFLSFEFSSFLSLPNGIKRSFLEPSPFGSSIFVFGGDTSDGPSSAAYSFDFGGLNGGSLSIVDTTLLSSPISGTTPLDLNRSVLSTDPSFVFDHTRRALMELPGSERLEGYQGARTFDSELSPSLLFMNGDDGKLLNESDAFDPLESPLLQDVSNGHLVTLTSHLALWLGGSKNGTLTRDGILFDARDKSLKIVENLLSEARNNPTLIVAGELLLAAGGTRDDESISTAVDVIDISELKYKETLELPTAIKDFALLAMQNGQALFMGGQNEAGESTDTFLIFNP